MERLQFKIQIHAPVEKVFQTMFGVDTYKQWTSEFSPTSDFEGRWEQDSKIMFTAINKEGKREGLLGTVMDFVPNSFVSVRYYGFLDGDDEITEGEAVQGYIGAYENYSFNAEGGRTSVMVDVDVEAAFKSYMLETYPKALERLKKITE